MPKINIQTPSVPRYIKISMGGNSTAYDQMVGIEEFTDEELKSIGDKWTLALFDRAKKIREVK